MTHYHTIDQYKLIVAAIDAAVTNDPNADEDAVARLAKSYGKHFGLDTQTIRELLNTTPLQILRRH